MANSRFDYVRDFETDDRIIPNCWIVVRVDGKAFHKFTQKHDFKKPNDDEGIFTLNHMIADTKIKTFLFFHRFKSNELRCRQGDARIHRYCVSIWTK